MLYFSSLISSIGILPIVITNAITNVITSTTIAFYYFFKLFYYHYFRLYYNNKHTLSNNNIKNTLIHYLNNITNLYNEFLEV